MASPRSTAYHAAFSPIYGGRFAPRTNVSLDLIAAAPENSWVRLNVNTYESVWPPVDFRAPYGSGTSSPATIIKAWSGFGWDSKNSRLVLWGGGHANSSGNEIYVWDAKTGLWTLGFWPSDVVSVPGSTGHDTIDGARHSPISSHTYASNNYLPTLDRFVVFGGAAHSTGGVMQLRDPVASNPPIRAIGCYTLDMTLAGQGYVGGLPGSNPHRGSSVGVDLPGAQAWEMRDWMDPSAQALTGFGPRTNSGSAVRVEGGRDVYYGMFNRNLFRCEFHSDWRDDVITQVGRYFSAGVSILRATAIHEAANCFVSTGNASKPFTFWRLDTVGASNNDQAVNAADLAGAGAAGLIAEPAGHSGLAYDPVRNRLLMWPWGGRVYEIMLPTTKPMPVTGWSVELVCDAASPRPMTKSEAEAVGRGSNGVVGKFRYAPDLDAFIGLQHTYAGNVWAYKPHGWQDPRF